MQYLPYAILIIVSKPLLSNACRDLKIYIKAEKKSVDVTYKITNGIYDLPNDEFAILLLESSSS